MSEAKKKIVRFGRGEGKSMEDESGWSEPQIKDSGIDTGMSSSSQTLNEEWLKVLFVRLPCMLIYCINHPYIIFCVGILAVELF